MTICEYFGVRTSKKVDALKCQHCRETNLKVFKKCTSETNSLLATSIDVDGKGNTVTVSPSRVSDEKLLVPIVVVH